MVKEILVPTRKVMVTIQSPDCDFSGTSACSPSPFTHAVTLRYPVISLSLSSRHYEWLHISLTPPSTTTPLMPSTSLTPPAVVTTPPHCHTEYGDAPPLTVTLSMLLPLPEYGDASAASS